MQQLIEGHEPGCDGKHSHRRLCRPPAVAGNTITAENQQPGHDIRPIGGEAPSPGLIRIVVLGVLLLGLPFAAYCAIEAAADDPTCHRVAKQSWGERDNPSGLRTTYVRVCY